MSHSSVDPDGLLEYSVVYTDRALNHMSKQFQQVMRDVSSGLKTVYGADAVIVMPGSGSFAMEAVARQFATGIKTLVVRNGLWSFRWSQIFEAGAIASETVVMMATRSSSASADTDPFSPPPIDEVVARIRAEQPKAVFAAHVETSCGIILPDSYISAIGNAAREVGALFVLDCIASGAMWVDMSNLSVDVLVTAPQKGWSCSSGCGLVMLGPRGVARLAETKSSSFAMDLNKWHSVMQAYEKGGHMYHATLPTDVIKRLRDAIAETQAFGFATARSAQVELGRQVRDVLEAHGFVSVAAQGFQAPGVVVSYTSRDDIKTGSLFMQHGMQIAPGVPMQCQEGDGFKTFRIGLFGMDKLTNIPRTVDNLSKVFEKIKSKV